MIDLVTDPAPPLPILLLKGPPGSGKTTFLLQLFDHLGREAVLGESYVNNLDSPPRLLARHGLMVRLPKDPAQNQPRLRRIPRDGLNRLLASIRAGHMGRDLVRQLVAGRDAEEESPVERAQGRDRAPEVGVWVDWAPPDEPTARDDEAPEESKDHDAEELSEIEGLYSCVERTNRLPAFLAVDSIDALARQYGIPAARLVVALQEDLVETGHAILVCVLDRAGTSALDTLADGAIGFDRASRSGHQEVIVSIERLRGREVEHLRYALRFRQNRLVADPTDADIVARLLGDRSFSNSADLFPR